MNYTTDRMDTGDSKQDDASQEKDNLEMECWKEQLKMVWQDFMEQTSLHGCKNVHKKQRKILTRCIWATILLIMAVALTVILVNLFFRYREYPFVTVWGLERKSEPQLPGLTLCLTGIYDKTKIEKLDPAYLRYFQRVRKYDYSSNNTLREESAKTEEILRMERLLDNVTYSAFRDKTSFSTDDIFLEAVIIGDGVFYSIRKFFEYNYDPFSGCWTLNRLKLKKERGVLLKSHESIHLVLSIQQDKLSDDTYEAGLNLYIHEPHPGFWSVQPLKIRPGTASTAIYSMIQYKFLPQPFKSFGTSTCVEHGRLDFDFHLMTWPEYSSAMCLHEISNNASVRVCGCAPTAFVSFFNVPECTARMTRDCVIPTLHSVYFEEYEKGKNSTGRCIHTCSYSEFDVTLSSSDFPAINSVINSVSHGFFKNHEDAKKNGIYLEIREKSSAVTTVEHIPELTLLGIFGNVGGFMGLFLGASLLTLSELIEALLMSLWIIHTRMFHEIR